MLGLRSKITLLAMMTSLLVVSVLYLTILYAYTTTVYNEVDTNLVTKRNFVARVLQFDHFAHLTKAKQVLRITTRSVLEDIYFVLRNKEMRVIRNSTRLNSDFIPAPNILVRSGSSYATFTHRDQRYRVYNTLFNKEAKLGRELYVLQVVTPLAVAEQKITDLQKLLFFIIPIPLVLTAIGAWWVASASIRPVTRLINAVNEIGPQDLESRLPVERQDEIGQMSVAFNHLLDRIRKAFDSLRRFTADASHEIRTPLTSLRSQAEVALSRKREGSEYRETISNMLEDLDRLNHLIDLLLELARGDAGLIRIKSEDCNVSNLVSQWTEYFEPLAEEQEIELRKEIRSNISASIDQMLFERIVVNLVENAIMYSPEGAVVTVLLSVNESELEFSVCNNKTAIPEAAREKIFERFVRLDQTRHRSSGSGLGLSVVKWAVEAHQGTVRIVDKPEYGVCFEVRIPVA